MYALRSFVPLLRRAELDELANEFEEQERGRSAVGWNLDTLSTVENWYNILRDEALLSIGMENFEGAWAFPTPAMSTFLAQADGVVLGMERDEARWLKVIALRSLDLTVRIEAISAEDLLATFHPAATAQLYTPASTEDVDILTVAALRLKVAGTFFTQAGLEAQGISIQDQGQKIIIDAPAMKMLAAVPGMRGFRGPIWGDQEGMSPWGPFQATSGAPTFPGARSKEAWYLRGPRMVLRQLLEAALGRPIPPLRHNPLPALALSAIRGATVALEWAPEILAALQAAKFAYDNLDGIQRWFEAHGYGRLARALAAVRADPAQVLTLDLKATAAEAQRALQERPGQAPRAEGKEKAAEALRQLQNLQGLLRRLASISGAEQQAALPARANPAPTVRARDWHVPEAGDPINMQMRGVTYRRLRGLVELAARANLPALSQWFIDQQGAFAGTWMLRGTWSRRAAADQTEAAIAAVGDHARWLHGFGVRFFQAPEPMTAKLMVELGALTTAETVQTLKDAGLSVTLPDLAPVDHAPIDQLLALVEEAVNGAEEQGRFAHALLGVGGRAFSMRDGSVRYVLDSSALTSHTRPQVLVREATRSATHRLDAEEFFLQVAGEAGTVSDDPATDVYHTTESTRRAANVAALSVLRRAQASRDAHQGRLPELNTVERATLREFSGWGGIDVDRLTLPERLLLKPDQQEYLRIKGERERETAALLAKGQVLRGAQLEARLPSFGASRGAWEGMIAQYFTPPEVSDAMAEWARRTFDATNDGRRPVRLLEPSAGIGRLVRAWERLGEDASAVRAVEIDGDMADMLRLLWPTMPVVHGALEQWMASNEGRSERYDLVLANPPYAKRGRWAKVDPDYAQWAEEADYFLVRTADALAPRGIMCQLTPVGVINGSGGDSLRVRRELLRTCHLFAAVQIPGDVFPGARLNLAISIWGRRPRKLDQVLVDDQAILDGRYFDLPGHAAGIMGKAVGGKSRRYAEIIEGTFDPEVMYRQPVRIPDPTYQEQVSAPGPAAVGRIEKPSSVGMASGARGEAFTIGETLGYRVLRFQEALAASDQALATRMQPELLGDVRDYLSSFGSPHRIVLPASVQPSASWRALLSVIDPRTATLAPILADVVDVPPEAYRGPQDPVAAALFLIGRRGSATLPELARLLGRGVAPSELVGDDRLYLTQGPPEAGGIAFERDVEYLSGECWPKYDWCKLVLRGQAGLPDGLPLNAALRARLERQAQQLLDAIAPVPIGEIDVGIRSHWIYERSGSGIAYDATYLLEWMRQEYGANLKRARVEHGVLVVVGPSEYTEQVSGVVAYFNRTDTVRDHEGKRKKRQQETGLEDRMAADRQRDEAFRLFLRAHKDAPLIAERYNRFYRNFVSRSYSEEPLPLARLNPELAGLVKPYQWAAIRRAIERRGGIEALDVGLGKTLVACMIAAAMRESGSARRIMFSVPNTVGPNWLGELATWLPTFRVVSIGFTVRIEKDGSITSTADTMETVERKLREFAAGVYDCAVVQHSTFEAFSLDPDNVRLFYTEHFAAQREAALADYGAAADERRIESLTQELRSVGAGTKKAKQLQDQIDRLAVTPWLERIQDQLDAARRDPKGARKVKSLEKELQKFANKQSPSDRKRATEQQKFEEWVERRIRPGKIALLWEQIGVDALFIDEMHEYKNLYGPATRYGEKLRYMGAMAADKVVARCWDLWAKCAWLRSKRNDTGVFGLTATPLKNSPLEAYNLLCYITDVAFRSRGLLGPENFIDRYCQGEAEPVLTMGGGFDEQLAVKTFTNLAELRTIFEAWVDVKVAVPFDEYARLLEAGENLRGIVPLNIPNAKTTLIDVPMTPQQLVVYEEMRKVVGGNVEQSVEQLCASLEKGPRGKDECGPKGCPDEDLDDEDLVENPLLVNDGDDEGEDEDDESSSKGAEILKAMDQMSKAALDIELLGQVPDQTPPKFVALANEAAKRRGCAQIIFCDYTESHPRIIHELVTRAGIPRERIVAVKATNMTPGQRQDVARRLNGEWDAKAGRWLREPTLDVVIGGKAIEQGINLQMRTCVIHHLTFSWEPATPQQRNGRGVRQGNWLALQAGVRPVELRDLASLVEILWYASERSFDGYKISLTAGKQGWMKGLLRSADNVINNPGASLNGPCAQIIALAADKEKAEAFCACLENRAAARALARRRAGALKHFGRLVMLREQERRVAHDPTLRAHWKNQADSLERLLRGLPDDIFARKDLIAKAADVALYFDAKGDKVWVAGTAVCVQNHSTYVESINYQGAVLRIRRMGEWLSQVVTFGEIAQWAERVGGDCEWSHEQDRKELARHIEIDKLHLIRDDVFAARRAELLTALSYVYFHVPYIHDGVPRTVTVGDATRWWPSEEPLWPQVEGNADLFIRAVRAQPKPERKRLVHSYSGAYERWFGRKYPKDLYDEAKEP